MLSDNSELHSHHQLEVPINRMECRPIAGRGLFRQHSLCEYVQLPDNGRANRPKHVVNTINVLCKVENQLDAAIYEVY
jgi:hypothetical protein